MKDKIPKEKELTPQVNNYHLKEFEVNTKLMEELERQRDFNNTFIQSTSVFFVSIQANGKLLLMNDPMLKALGYSKQEVLGKDYLTTFVPANERNKLSKIFEKLSRLHQNTFNENHVLTKDGRLLLVEWHGTPILKGKEFDYFIGIGLDITERKRTEKRIEGFSKIFEESLNEIYIFDSETYKFLYVNKGALKNIGYSKDELLKLTPIDIKPEYDKNSFDELLRSIRNGKKQILDFETFHKRKDGSLYPIEVHLQKSTFENKNVFFAIILDITKRKKSEILLKESEKKYRLLFDNNLTAVYTSTVDGKIIECNNAFVEMFGYKSKEELLKINASSLYNTQTERKIFIQKLKKSGTLTNYEESGRKKDGSLIFTLMSVNLISENVMQGAIIDITKSKKDQAEILKLSRGIEQSPYMIIITDVEGNIEYVNPKITEVTGYSKEELIGKNPRIFSSGKTPDKIFEELWDTIIYGKTWNGELINKRKNGELYWEKVTIAPIIDNEGNIMNYIGIKEDITEKKMMMEELIKAKEKAEELYKLKSSFLSNMSHELRTPLVGILGFTEILEEDIQDPELNKIASLINENGKRLLETLNLILNLSKFESESVELELTEFDVLKEVNRSIKLFEKSALKKNIFIKINNNVDNLIIHSDVRMFYDILNNLINNAVKFTDEGGITVYVGISDDYKYAEIKVGDTGIGIPKDKLEIIWEEFRQVSEGTTRAYEGTGLGLTITSKYIKKLKGKITLESELGKGSTFTVLIPINVMFYPVTAPKSESS